jgi:hypothetical protein
LVSTDVKCPVKAAGLLRVKLPPANWCAPPDGSEGASARSYLPFPDDPFSTFTPDSIRYNIASYASQVSKEKG